jgi:TRAP transporter TAXI family solute receptor
MGIFKRGLLLSLFVCVAATGATAQARKPDIRIATGTPGGAYYVMGAVLAEALNKSGRVNSATAEASSGAIESSRLMSSGEITIGGMDAPLVIAGLRGQAPFKDKVSYLTVAPLGYWALFFIGLESSNITSLEQIKGKRIAIGAKGSGMEAHARYFFNALGWSFDDIRPVYQAFGPGAASTREGKVDLQFQCCIPNGGLTELTELSRTRVVATPPELLQKMLGTEGLYTQSILKKGALRGHDTDLPVVSIQIGWFAVPTLPEETAYIIMKTMLENIEQFAERSPQYRSAKELFDDARAKSQPSLLEMGAPLHPGSVRAFREAGIIK